MSRKARESADDYCRHSGHHRILDDDNNIDGGGGWIGDGELKRVSRQARELSLLLSMLSIMMITVLTAVVDFTTYNYFSFVEIRIFDADLGRQIRILTPSRVELIGKGSIFGLETAINR